MGRARTADEVINARSERGAGRRMLVAVAIGVGLILVAHLLDETVWRQWRDPRVNERDWGRMFRTFGYLPTWIILAIAFWTHDYPRTEWKRRGGFLLLAPLVGGIIAELAKLVVRRVRPDPLAFDYVFRSFVDDPISTRGLGMPSSHVIVAFAGAAALSRLMPRAQWLWYLLAIGCALTRVLSLWHYLSDVVAAAVLGWFVAAVLWWRVLRV